MENLEIVIPYYLNYTHQSHVLDGSPILYDNAFSKLVSKLKFYCEYKTNLNIPGNCGWLVRFKSLSRGTAHEGLPFILSEFAPKNISFKLKHIQYNKKNMQIYKK